MDQVEVLLIILCLLFFHVRAQSISNSDQVGVLEPLRPSLAAVIGVISVMISITFIVLAYAKFCRRDEASRLSHDNNRQTLTLVRSRSKFSGIDKEVIDSLPFFRFSSLRGSKEGLECAVCLSGFDDTEILRLLPKCKHAFHKNCIDQWLESHSSCPLCRYKLDPEELKSFSYSSSLRYMRSPPNLTDDPNLELFIQREKDYQGSFRFNLGKVKDEELLIQKGNDNNNLLHKFKHKIIVSDVLMKNRWSDVNSSDLLSLSSEMLNIMSSNRFLGPYSKSARFQSSLSRNEDIEKIKEDIARKRLYESRIIRSNSFSASCFASTSYQSRGSSKMINPAEKRSMSEITICSRYKDTSVKKETKESTSPGSIRIENVDTTRRIWLRIARRTVQWFAGRQEAEHRRQPSNV